VLISVLFASQPSTYFGSYYELTSCACLCVTCGSDFIMSASSKKQRRKRQCTTCGRLAVDHSGPCGKKCQLSPLKFDEEDSGEDKHSEHGSSKSHVLNELADQLGQLAASMQQLKLDMTDLQKDKIVHASKDAGLGSRTTRTASEYMSAGGGAFAATTEANVCLPSGAKVSQKVLQQTRTGEYINISDYAPCLEPCLSTETTLVDGELIFRPKRQVKNIDSFLMWSMCWRGYEEVLVTHDPSLYPQLCAYRIFVQTCAAKFWWTAVYSYDVRNRGAKSMSRSFDFNVLDNDIYVTTMDSSTTRQNIRQCSRCKSIWHVVTDCPFSEGGAMAQGPRQAPTASRSSASSTKSQNTQICFNWNAGRCSGPCNRRHVCEGCGGPDPRPRCPTCNFFAKHKPPPGQSGGSASASSNPPQQSRVG
jgi:hypothetical protein